MQIRELRSERNNKGAVISLSYEEIRDLANALYCLTTGVSTKTDYSSIAANMHLLFDLVKHGNIQKHSIDKLHELSTKNQPPKIQIFPLDIEIFEEYIKNDMDKTAKENGDWCHSYALAIQAMKEHLVDESKSNYDYSPNSDSDSDPNIPDLIPDVVPGE